MDEQEARDVALAVTGLLTIVGKLVTRLTRADALDAEALSEFHTDLHWIRARMRSETFQEHLESVIEDLPANPRPLN